MCFYDVNTAEAWFRSSALTTITMATLQIWEIDNDTASRWKHCWCWRWNACHASRWQHCWRGRWIVHHASQRQHCWCGRWITIQHHYGHSDLEDNAANIHSRFLLSHHPNCIGRVLADHQTYAAVNRGLSSQAMLLNKSIFLKICIYIIVSCLLVFVSNRCIHLPALLKRYVE